MSAAPVIEVDSIVTRFGRQTVHDGVSFSVPRGPTSSSTREAASASPSSACSALEKRTGSRRWRAQ